MLDLLTTVTKTSQPSVDSISEERLSIWYKNIVPLLFDDVPAVQNAAIRAVEALLVHLGTIPYENHAEWQAAKAYLSE